jgi:hypothetical protein
MRIRDILGDLVCVIAIFGMTYMMLLGGLL